MKFCDIAVLKYDCLSETNAVAGESHREIFSKYGEMSSEKYNSSDSSSSNKKKNKKMQTLKSGNCLPREFGSASSTPTAYQLSAEDKLLIMESLDHIHVLRQYQQMGSCSVCKKISIKKCPGCGIFYCSDECQTFDWPKHQAICPDQRDSMSERNSLASARRRRGGSFVKQFNGEVLMMTDRSSPFTSLANQLSKKTGAFYSGSKSFASFKINNKPNQNKDRASKFPDMVYNGTKDSKKGLPHDRNGEKKKIHSPKQMTINKKTFTEEKKEASISKNDFRSVSDESSSKPVSEENVSIDIKDKPQQKTVRRNWVKPEPVEVIGTYRESSNRYWVMAVRNLKKYEEIQDILNKYCGDYEPVIPAVGLKCGCLFSDEWYRAEIVSLAPETIVHFIDYGNSTNYELNIFKKLPNHIQSTPGLAFLIQFDEGTPEDYRTKDLDSIRFLVMESSKAYDGTPIVKVVDGLYGSTSETEKVFKPTLERAKEISRFARDRSAMDSIKANSSGMMFFVPGEGTLRFASIVPDNNKDASDCIEKVLCIDNPNSSPINAEEGELVLATDKEGNDQRGRVVAKLGATYFVQLIDCGNVISTDNVYSLPEKYKDLMELGVKVIIEEIISPEMVKRLETCFFSINGEANRGKWPCTLRTSEQITIAKVLLEKPIEVMQWQPQYAFLKSGATVEISSLCPPNFFYVRSVDVETEQKFLDMNMEILQYAPKAKSLTSPPLPGEMCCARFLEDDCFYRAVVNSIEHDKIWIVFVDFGNEQKTDLKDLKPIPECLKKIPLFAIKVKLRNVSLKPWNNMIKEYIEKLITENIELTLTYSDSINHGVVLREKVSGVVVNDFIEKARAKSQPVGLDKNIPSQKEEIYLDDDLKYTKVPPNTVCDLAVLHINEGEFESNHTFWAAVSDVENFAFVNGDLSIMISDYCTRTSTPYKPSFRELCLAEFEDSWYRAICIGNEGDLHKVFFVDFGNFCELKADSIRKMNKDFIKAPALAMNCTINGREKLKSNPEATGKIFKIIFERLNTVLQNVTVIKFEEDTFFLKIPDIEGLLSD